MTGEVREKRSLTQMSTRGECGLDYIMYIQLCVCVCW